MFEEVKKAIFFQETSALSFAESCQTMSKEASCTDTLPESFASRGLSHLPCPDTVLSSAERKPAPSSIHDVVRTPPRCDNPLAEPSEPTASDLLQYSSEELRAGYAIQYSETLAPTQRPRELLLLFTL